MKRTISLWTGLLAFALLPALAQTPAPTAPTGKIHGHVTNPTGAVQTSGTVSLSNDGGHTLKFTFPVAANGDYTGEATPGTYMVIFRQLDTAPGKTVDLFDGIKIVVGQDVLQDIDMSRKAFIDRLPSDEQKKLEEFKKHNAEAMKENVVVNNLNADLRLVTQDIKDADGARAAAVQALGATATRANIDAKEAEIKAAKYAEIETLMLKDTAAKADASVLWKNLGKAQVGLARVKDDKAKYDEAETNLKKAIELEVASKKPSLLIQGDAEAGLGEIYARTGKIPEANAAYDAAVKDNPSLAGTYLANEAVIFSNVGNGEAQIAAADEAIKADPTQALPYYLKGQGLIQKATIDPKTGKMILPDGCAEAYQKYLALAPNGQFANDVTGILAEAAQTHNTAFGTVNPKKKGK